MNDNLPLSKRVGTMAPIWFVPLIALVIAAWLAFRSWQGTGPQIVIVLEDAAGVSVGKTLVRYRDVAVGKVTDIKLSDGYEKVSVYVELDRDVEDLVSENTRFWVVSPRISLGGVSGLQTLVTGVHIEFDPGEPGAQKTQFIGLDDPPAVRSYEAGTQYILLAETLGALDIGSPVYHRQIRVGEVTRYKLLPTANKVEIRIFIESPYDELIRSNTNFWNVGGVSVELGADGIEAKIGSLVSIIAGGLEFNTPPSLTGTQARAEAGKHFYLFDDEDAVAEGALAVSYPYLLRFNSSVRGLSNGSSVEFRGIKVGKVEHVGFDTVTDSSRKVDVIIAIQPERIDPESTSSMEELTSVFEGLVEEGMKAQLKSKSLITGALYVDLVPEAGEGTSLKQKGNYIEIPTADNDINQVASSLADFAEKIQALPVASIGKSIDKSLAAMSRLFTELDESHIVSDLDELVQGLNGSNKSLGKAVKGLEQALRSVDQTIAPDSELHYRLNQMLKDVSAAAKSFEQLSDELTRYPNALIVGKDKDNK